MAENRPQGRAVKEQSTAALSVDETNAQPHHRFKPLQDPKQTFRILRLLSTNGDDSIRATMSEKSFGQPIQTHYSKYLALSYEWGDPGNRQSIEVDGQQYLVRRNLYNYLTAARDNQWLDDAEIFIDAICIDQENKAEKSDQVSQMSNIYSQATHVVVCLGPAENNSDRLFEMYREEFTMNRLPLKDDPDPSQFVHPAAAFLTCTYRRRLWVVPEIIVARTVTLFWGHSLLPFNRSVFSKTYQLSKTSEGIVPLARGSRTISFLAWATTEYQEREAPSYELDYLISLFKKRLCVDPRDHVYALLSINLESRKGS